MRIHTLSQEQTLFQTARLYLEHLARNQLNRQVINTFQQKVVKTNKHVR